VVAYLRRQNATFKKIEELRVFARLAAARIALRLFTSREALDRGTRRAGAR
jgi:hypothetical protein